MDVRRVIAFLFVILLPVYSFSQTDRFNADSTYAYIEHLSVTIGPRPMGSLNERIALNWAVDKFRSFGADSAYMMKFQRVGAENSSVNTNSGVAVGIFRGESDSTIVIGGHVDSAGREIPGANDNASGAACVIELARLWSRRQRHYSMVFLAFGGEEQGLVGSLHFVDHYRDIDHVSLMISIDMAGCDDKIMTIFETDSIQTPAWLVKDAFAVDRALGVDRLQYPTHFSSLNNVIDMAGSDHIPFLSKNIPAIDFTAGMNNSPIHTPRDKIDFISKPMLDRCGRLVDGLLTRYQEQGIPVSRSGPFMLWRPLGISIFIPAWMVVIFNITALGLGIWAFIRSRKNRLRIEKKERVRFSGFKLFGMITVVAVFAQLGEAFLGLVRGLRYPWVVHISSYLWFAALWAVAGLWVVLQITRRWKFSPDPYVYTKRALLILFIFIIPLALFGSMRLALYPAMTFFLISLAVLIPIPWMKPVLSFVAPLPMFRLMFMEVFPFIGRFSSLLGLIIDNFWKALLYSSILVVVLVIWYLPAMYAYAYPVVVNRSLKTGLKTSRKPIFGIILLVVIVGYGGYLYSLPAYNEMWRPVILVEAEYNIQKKESKLKLIGNEVFRDVHVSTDSLEKEYAGRTHKEELEHSFTADWISVHGDETIKRGERDTLSIDWTIASERPWHNVSLTIEVDTLELEDVHSSLKFRHDRDRLRFSWSADPPEALAVEAGFTVEPGARLIRRISARYADLPIRMDIVSEKADIIFRTTVVHEDTLVWETHQITDGIPDFELHQPELFEAGETLTNAFADFDNDGDLDLFVGFRGKPNRLYRNDNGTFEDVAREVGIADSDVTRTSAWGDYNGDGHIDLFVGFVSRSESWNRLYRNEGDGKHFTDVTEAAGVELSGSFRQATWVDFDNDGDVDLFVGLRDKPNVLFRNENGKFTDVAKKLGVDDPRRTVGAAWFDYDKDGDLDLYVTNMDGDANGMFRNDGTRFTDVAQELGLDSGGRPLGSEMFGSVRPSLADFDNDGNIDIFLANYGPNGLYKNEGNRKFKNVAPELGLAIDNCYDTGTWGDFDNNGRLDLYVNGTITRGKSYEDYLFRSDENRFTDITPELIKKQNADHGAHWVDFDGDGDLDLALTGAAPDGMHYLLRNKLPKERARRSLQVMVLDAEGHYTRAGTEIRLYEAGTRNLLGTNLLDTGSGYNSQNAMPVHFGLPQEGPVDVEIITMTNRGRKSGWLTNVNPKDYAGRYLVVKVDQNGNILE